MTSTLTHQERWILTNTERGYPDEGIASSMGLTVTEMREMRARAQEKVKAEDARLPDEPGREYWNR
jgi:FixJ family two-component response regulator